MSELVPLDQFVEQQLASGKYQSYDAMVQEGLRLLQGKRSQGSRGSISHHSRG